MTKQGPLGTFPCLQDVLSYVQSAQLPCVPCEAGSDHEAALGRLAADRIYNICTKCMNAFRLLELEAAKISGLQRCCDTSAGKDLASSMVLTPPRSRRHKHHLGMQPGIERLSSWLNIELYGAGCSLGIVYAAL